MLFWSSFAPSPEVERESTWSLKVDEQEETKGLFLRALITLLLLQQNDEKSWPTPGCSFLRASFNSFTIHKKLIFHLSLFCFFFCIRPDGLVAIRSSSPCHFVQTSSGIKVSKRKLVFNVCKCQLPRLNAGKPVTIGCGTIIRALLSTHAAHVNKDKWNAFVWRLSVSIPPVLLRQTYKVKSVLWIAIFYSLNKGLHVYIVSYWRYEKKKAITIKMIYVDVYRIRLSFIPTEKREKTQ